ncbi:hypothetical protein [Actinotignum timonense]
MAKILMVLYPDPVDGFPPKYIRDSIPTIDCYPGGSSTPTPSGIDFTRARWWRASPAPWA